MEATIQYIKQELNGLYPKTEIEALVRLIIEHVCRFNYTEQILFKQHELDEPQKKYISEIVDRIKKYEPVQYILEETEFLGLNLRISPSVFIPRPETEELVHWITGIKLPHKPSILDIGTGSGCIALGIKKLLPDARVSAIDISEAVLKVAYENAASNGLDVSFFQSDILRWRDTEWDMYDLIVSNPPYVRESEKADMFYNVLDYEPKRALFVSDSDPLLFYRHIVEFSRSFLHENGWLFFEINEKSGHEILFLIEQNGFKDIKIKNDIFGKERMIRCRR